ncbi:MAG: hypothetical protein AUK55_14315 [Syntrophobacteraceae bacterium CG2_30_61_12]|nr:MAG: hypothetical protein AUK55_14315 [Syntrophobacteraceae bacterium CG2_30_61_12]PIU32583.1 MAG: hypothetical protein COT06_01955 [Syntrophobacteraceae bacterium CG07_land_8_20_14_0_80_61_8]
MLERRVHQRTKRSYRIFWNHEEVRCAGVTLDICPGGIFVVTCMPLIERSRLDLEIWIGDSVRPLRCRGEVVWVNRGQIATFPPGFGLKLVELNGNAAEVLIRLCTGEDAPEFGPASV